MIKLRDYQLEAIEEVKFHFLATDRQYIEMPTGAGKTVTFLKLATEYSRVLVIVPSRELLKQVYDSACLFFSKSEISRKGSKYDEQPSKIHICIINSIRGKYLEYITRQYFSLVIIDEAHHVQADSYRRLINGIVEDQKLYKKTLKVLGGNTQFLGVTATPDRSDGKLIRELLDACTYRISIEELISQNFLCDVKGFCLHTKIDLSEIHDHNGDFSISQLYKKLCTNFRNNLIIDTYKKNMLDRKCLIFCINVEHSKRICDLLKNEGISAAHIDGTMNDNVRHSILSSFRNGEIQVITNCQLLTEGFDEPSINGIILARPTTSKALFLQMVGRGLRICDGKTNCKIIDIVDSHKSLAGFNNLIDDSNKKCINSFNSLKQIKEHVENLRVEQAEFIIKRTDLFNSTILDDQAATDSMLQYLQQNNIYHEQNISFDEASFLIWKHKLEGKYQWHLSKK